MAFELDRLVFRAASDRNGTPSPVTVLVGPNNSGKSLALREIDAWTRGSDERRAVIEEIDVLRPESRAEVESLIAPFVTSPNEGEIAPPDSILLQAQLSDHTPHRVWLQWQPVMEQLPLMPMVSYVRQTLMPPLVGRMDGRTRFALMDDRPLQDLQRPPEHHLAALFADDVQRAEVRRMVLEAFPGRHFVIDPTAMQQFRVRMSDRPPLDSAEERNWDERARAFHAAAVPITSLSDGVICFTGLVAAAVSQPYRIMLIDEPEAFLHPPLARLLGANLATLTARRGASLVTATHSAEFLMGCIESGVETTIVRLTYEDQQAGARVLAPQDLQPLMRDPLLRSTRALTGLFHRGVVVGESDHDRAFYEEINRRLTAEDRGSLDTLFTTAQNWQTTARVIAPLRQLGVPAAAILDLDVLWGRAPEWTKFYDAAGLSPLQRKDLEDRRNAFNDALVLWDEDNGRARAKRDGLAGLRADVRRAGETVVKGLAAIGVFLVPVGELEGWLPALGVTSRAKGKWIVEMFETIGTTPVDEGYVRPASDDVWLFLDQLAKWISDPARAGMPA
jgi:hypothetical protein